MENSNAGQIIEDIKWFMFDEQETHENIKNEMGFSHGLKFVTWCGDGCSFIVTDGSDEYRIIIRKEIP